MALKYKYLLLIFLILFDMGFIPHFGKYDINNKIIVIIFYLLTAFAIFKVLSSSKKQRQQTKNEEQSIIKVIEAIKNEKEPPYQTSSIILKAKEHTYISMITQLSEVKTKAVGSVGSSAGLSFGLGGGVRLHTGSGHRRTVYNNVKQKYSGEFVVTNQRIVFINNKKGFELPVSKITSLTSYSHNLMIQANKTNYTINTKHSQLLEELIREILNRKNKK